MAFPVTILGGYLGSGKTTLVNHILRNNTNKKIAILVNEFGDLPIDEDLIESRDDNLISLAGGCICCSYGDALIETLSELSSTNKNIDHILIETSGVAMPGMVSSSISLISNLSIFGIVVVVDSNIFLSLKDDEYMADTIERQIVSANLIILNKTDLCSEKKISDVVDALSKINSKVEIIFSTFGNAESTKVLKPFSASVIIDDATFYHKPDEIYDSLKYKGMDNFDLKMLAGFLTSQDNHIIRSKGFLFDKNGSPCVIQTVGMHSYISAVKKVREPGIVLIGLKNKMHKQSLEKRLLTFVVD